MKVKVNVHTLSTSDGVSLWQHKVSKSLNMVFSGPHNENLLMVLEPGNSNGQTGDVREIDWEDVTSNFNLVNGTVTLEL